MQLILHWLNYLLLGDLQQAEAHTISAVQAIEIICFIRLSLRTCSEKKVFNEAAELFEVIAESRTINTEYFLAAIDCYKRCGSYSKAIKVIENLEQVKEIGSKQLFESTGFILKWEEQRRRKKF